MSIRKFNSGPDAFVPASSVKTSSTAIINEIDTPPNKLRMYFFWNKNRDDIDIAQFNTGRWNVRGRKQYVHITRNQTPDKTTISYKLSDEPPNMTNGIPPQGIPFIHLERARVRQPAPGKDSPTVVLSREIGDAILKNIGLPPMTTEQTIIIGTVVNDHETLRYTTQVLDTLRMEKTYFNFGAFLYAFLFVQRVTVTSTTVSIDVCLRVRGATEIVRLHSIPDEIIKRKRNNHSFGASLPDFISAVDEDAISFDSNVPIVVQSTDKDAAHDAVNHVEHK
jgi:hypothetical protein